MPGLRNLILLLFFSTTIRGQDHTMNGLSTGGFEMTFPSIYFKHNSNDYAVMPYSVDSCFKHIAANIKHLNSFPVWRDSVEKDSLTYLRIQKLKTDLNKYVPSKYIRFQGMGAAQKVTRQTIEKSKDDKQKQYLLSLNSVLDLSGTIKNKAVSGKEKKQKKGMPRLVWCGWKYGFHWSSNGNKPKKSKK